MKLKKEKDVKEILLKIKKTLPTITRASLSYKLNELFKELDGGRILDIGSMAAPHKSKLKHINWISLDISTKHKPNIVGDAHYLPLQNESFDVVLATEVLEHCQYPQIVINDIQRVLKNDGICILSTRFVYPFHPCPKDYFRFTADSLNFLFRNFRKVNVNGHGNPFLCVWELFTTNFPFYFLRILNPGIAKINSVSKDWPLGFVVMAKK